MYYGYGYVNTEESDELVFSIFSLFAYFIWGASMFYNDTGVAFWARLSFAMGIFTLCLRINVAVRNNPGLTYTRELWFGLQHPCDNIFTTVLFWPVWLPFALFDFFTRHGISYGEEYRSYYWCKLKRERFGMKHNTAHECADAKLDQLVSQADKVEEAVGKTVGQTAETMKRAAATTAVVTVVTTNTGAEERKVSDVIPPITFQVITFSDVGAERQLWFKVHHREFAIAVQNRITADGESAFSFAGIGRKFILKSEPEIAVTVIGGPQYTYENGEVDRLVIFADSTVKRGKFFLLSINRFSFGVNPKKTPFANRHVQMVLGIPKLPSWIGIQAEEFHGPKGFGELFFGPIFQKKSESGGFWSKFSLYPYFDAVKKTFDVRLAFVHTF